MPVIYGLLQRFILLPREGYRDGLGLDLARPLVAGAAGSWSPVLDIPVADPTQAPQAGPEPGIFVFNLSKRDVHE